MSRVSHFQRFSQPENHATNDTLLLLRYFYQSSPFKIQSVLTSSTGNRSRNRPRFRAAGQRGCQYTGRSH